VYICDGCHRPYQRGIRKPRPNQDNFCPDCRKHSKAAKRLWAVRTRARPKEKTLTHEEER